ncbi:MAG: RNA polymerase sigma factor [Bacteroidetes bacterium]|nr:RNA polymerase sigma factor [Bacteroidota bacterium]
MTLEKFKKEVFPLKNKLYRFAKGFFKSVPEAEDIVQEVLLRLWTKHDVLEEFKSIEAFAMTVTRNLCLDRLKSKGYRTEELTLVHQQVSHATPYKKLEMEDTYGKIQMILNTLPEQQRQIVHLRDIEGFEFEEISEILKINLNTIRVNLSRARKRIKETLQNTYDYEFAKN